MDLGALDRLPGREIRRGRRHHDAIEFPDGGRVLVTQLSEGQRVTVLQLPVVHQVAGHAQPAARTATAATPASID
jgi:hypothetical protein